MSFEEWARRAELAEAAGKTAWFRAVPEELAASLGLRVYRQISRAARATPA